MFPKCFNQRQRSTLEITGLRAPVRRLQMESALRHWDVDVEIEELRPPPPPARARRVGDLRYKVGDHGRRDRELHRPAPATGHPDAEDEGREPCSRGKRRTMSCFRRALLLQIRALLAA